MRGSGRGGAATATVLTLPQGRIYFQDCPLDYYADKYGGDTLVRVSVAALALCSL